MSEKSKNSLIQTDYTLPIGENTQFEFGYRGDFQDLNSNFLVNRIPELDFNPSNNLIFEQNVNAIYSQLGNKIKILKIVSSIIIVSWKQNTYYLNTPK